MTLYVYTLGCRLNQCESEAIADSFKKEGFTLTSDSKEARLIIVNSCTVTSKAEQKARRMIRLFAQTAEAILVTGCYVEVARKEVEALSDKVSVFTLNEKASLMDLPLHIKGALEGGLSLTEAVKSFSHRERSVFDFDPSSFSYHSRGYLKVQDGCDNSCGYCMTTIARGPSRWIEAEEAVRRVKKLEAEGFHEIMLTGCNLTNYDHDGEGLGGLLEKILSSVGPDMRFRLSSMEPDHVDDRLLEAIRDPRVQPHFHIPIQTASQHVLDIIGRKYSISHVDYIIRKLREYKDDPFIACDVIAGLPGERPEDAEETYRFLEEHEFSALHVFPYSPRRGTPLYGSRLKIEERVRDERALELRKLSEKLYRRYLSRQEGKCVEILVEKEGEGTTGNYLKAKVESRSGARIEEGALLKGTLTSILPVIVSVD